MKHKGCKQCSREDKEFLEKHERGKFPEKPVHPRGANDFVKKPLRSGYTYSVGIGLNGPIAFVTNSTSTSTLAKQFEYNVRKPSVLEIEASKLATAAVKLLIKKHNDYGPKNIADAPGGPLTGLAVRLHDKVARLANLTTNGKHPSNESLQDTFVDIVNYGLIGLLVLEGKWDK